MTFSVHKPNPLRQMTPKERSAFRTSEDVTFEMLAIAHKYGVTFDDVMIDMQYFADYLTTVGEHYPSGAICKKRDESVVDWLARTYAFSSASFAPEQNRMLPIEEQSDYQRYMSGIAFLSTELLIIQSRPPVFYISDIADTIYHDKLQYDKLFSPLLDVPIKPPYPSMFFAYDVYRESTSASLDIVAHVIDLNDHLILNLYTYPSDDESGLVMLGGITIIGYDPETYLIRDHAREQGFIAIEEEAREMIDEAIYVVLSEWVVGKSEQLGDDWDRERATDALQTIATPALYALFLLNCRNVDAEEEIVRRSRQERRRRERAGIGENQSYRVRVKVPGKKQYVYYGGYGKRAEPFGTAMHMVRGHFSRYTEERPLFGKYSGTFWIPPHFRGNKFSARTREGYEEVLDKEAG